MPHIMTFKLKAGSGVYATLECTEEPDASKSYCRSPYPEVCAIVFAFESDPAAAIQEYSSLEIELRRVSIAVPVKSPVGPFESQEAAEAWLASLGPRWGESSVVRLTSPADATDPAKEN